EVLVDVIDDYVAAWGSFDLLSCRANEARELSAAALQLRARCLERSLRKISYFLAETRSSPPFSATPEAARGLTSIAECQDDDALLSRTPTPDYDPVVGDALSDAIGRAYVNKTVGNSKVYFDMLEAAEASLRGRGRAIPEELLLDTLYGAELNNRHQYVAAEKLLLPALLRAEAHPDWTAERSRLRAALAAAVSHQPSRAQEGVLLARLSVAAATAIGDGGAHEMAALTALTNAALAADDVDLALAASKRAVGIARQYDGADESPWLSLRLNAAEALGARGHALGEAGQSEAAQDAYLAALAALEALGNRGLLYARIQNNLAALIESSDPSKAEQLLVAAAEIKQRLGLNAEAGLTLMNIGNARVRRGEFESALTAFRHAEAAFQPPTLNGTANLAYNRALALAGLERWQDAEASYRVVLDAADGLRLEDASPLVFSSLLGLGESLLGLNRRLDAGVVFERALVADQEALGPHARAELRLGLSRTVAFDDPTRARAFAREGLAIMPADAAGTELVRRLRVAGSDGESVASAGPTRDSD
ncbi:MAG: hypothetical protein JKY37_17130, partial [Nannocystaceae bacterium]|nr:hypothetical protein [Nannocystaceae bacterium]